MRTLYLECAMGAAGDMLMAALYELCSQADRAKFLADMNALLPGVAVRPHAARPHRTPPGRQRGGRGQDRGHDAGDYGL